MADALQHGYSAASDLFIEMEAAQYTKTGQGACGPSRGALRRARQRRQGERARDDDDLDGDQVPRVECPDARGGRDHHGLAPDLRGPQDRLRDVFALRLPPRRKGEDKRDGQPRLHPPQGHRGDRAAQGRADRIFALARPRGEEMRGRLPRGRPHHHVLGRRNAVGAWREEGHEVRLAALGRPQVRAGEDRLRPRHLCARLKRRDRARGAFPHAWRLQGRTTRTTPGRRRSASTTS